MTTSDSSDSLDAVLARVLPELPSFELQEQRVAPLASSWEVLYRAIRRTLVRVGYDPTPDTIVSLRARVMRDRADAASARAASAQASAPQRMDRDLGRDDGPGAIDSARVIEIAHSILHASSRLELVEYLRTLGGELRRDPRWPAIREIGEARLEVMDARAVAESEGRQRIG